MTNTLIICLLSAKRPTALLRRSPRRTNRNGPVLNTQESKMFYYIHVAKRTPNFCIWDPTFDCFGSFFKEEGVAKQALREFGLSGEYDFVRLYEGMLKDSLQVSTLVLGGEDKYVDVLADSVLSWDWLNGLTQRELVSPSQDCLWLVKSSVTTSWGNHPHQWLTAYLRKEDAVRDFTEETNEDETYSRYNCVVDGEVEGHRVYLYSVEWEKVVVSSYDTPANDSSYSNSELREVIKIRRP